MKYFPNHLIQTNTKWKKPVIPTRLGLWVPNVIIWKKKKMHRQIARFIALKYFTTNVSEVEKNALKCQFDKSQKNIFHMCLHLGILKQDGRSNSHSNVRLKHQLLRSWFTEISQKFCFFFSAEANLCKCSWKAPSYSRLSGYLPLHYLKNIYDYTQKYQPQGMFFCWYSTMVLENENKQTSQLPTLYFKRSHFWFCL